MAPMIDMVFLLLVFFMTVSTLAKDARPELELPSSATARIPQTSPPKHIISVRQQNEDYAYYWSNRKLDLDQLRQQVMERRQMDSEQFVFRGEPDLPWHIWKGLIAICRESGISDVVFATFEE